MGEIRRSRAARMQANAGRATHGWQVDTKRSIGFLEGKIGGLPVADIDTDLIVRILMPVWSTKTQTATRLRGRIESILDRATVSKYLQGENPARWRGYLDHLLGNPNKLAPVRNRPALPWLEMPAFMADLVGREGSGAAALKFVILTACRSGEVRGATWSEIDLGAAVWTILANRMKAGKEHRVPLSAAVMRLLRALSASDEFVFEGARRGSPPFGHESDRGDSANGSRRHYRSGLSFDVPGLVR